MAAVDERSYLSRTSGGCIHQPELVEAEARDDDARAAPASHVSGGYVGLALAAGALWRRHSCWRPGAKAVTTVGLSLPYRISSSHLQVPAVPLIGLNPVLPNNKNCDYNMADKFPEIQPGGSLILAWQVKGKKVLVVGGGEVYTRNSTSIKSNHVLLTACNRLLLAALSIASMQMRR